MSEKLAKISSKRFLIFFAIAILHWPESYVVCGLPEQTYELLKQLFFVSMTVFWSLAILQLILMLAVESRCKCYPIALEGG